MEKYREFNVTVTCAGNKKVEFAVLARDNSEAVRTAKEAFEKHWSELSAQRYVVDP